MDDITSRDLLPNRVQHILSRLILLVQADRGPCFNEIVFFRRILILAPAEELIASALELRRTCNRIHTVVGLVFNGNSAHVLAVDLRRTAVSVKFDQGFRDSRPVNGIQRHIRGADGQLVARIIALRTGGIMLIRAPVEEHLVFRGSDAAGALHISLSVLRILLAVSGRSARTVVHAIGDLELIRADIVRVQRNITVNLRVEVERRVGVGAVPIIRARGPADPLVSIRNDVLRLRHGFVINRFAVRHGNCPGLVSALDLQVNCARIGRRSPLGIDGNVFRRHCPIEVVCYSAGTVREPSLELIFPRYGSRPCGFIVLRLGNARLVGISNFLIYASHIVVDNFIRIAIVIEGRTIILFSCCSARSTRNQSKTINRISVFVTNRPRRTAFYFIKMMNLEILSRVVIVTTF